MALTPITEFCKLTAARDSLIWEDLVENGYEDLGDHLTLAGEGDEVVNSIDLASVMMADIVTIIGRGDGMCSAYDKRLVVFVDKQGTAWFNAADFDEYFC